MENNANVYLTLDQVATMLGKHTRTVRRLVTRGALRGYHIPGSRGLYFKRADIEAALQPVEPSEADEE